MSPEYFTEIESHFATRRGTPFVLNAKDWALMKSWSDEGIPLPVVIEALDSVFDKNEAKGNKKTINGLSYCKHAVKELWQERKELQIGAEGASPDKRDYRVDFGKIGRLLPSFEPAWTVPAGIDELVTDMTRYGLTSQEFEHTFVRLEQINRLTAAGRLDEHLRRVGAEPPTAD